ncbi:hypothetical protein HanXRQr2_Chr04g0142301 [Helianthus annuus]|nr:hypothetical protein HanXRQr2_Chr04g0142301 [Helianthus annuus]
MMVLGSTAASHDVGRQRQQHNGSDGERGGCSVQSRSWSFQNHVRRNSTRHFVRITTLVRSLGIPFTHAPSFALIG